MAPAVKPHLSSVLFPSSSVPCAVAAGSHAKSPEVYVPAPDELSSTPLRSMPGVWPGGGVQFVMLIHSNGVPTKDSGANGI